MHICSLMKKQWRNAGLYESNSVKMQAFLEFMEMQSNQDWTRGVQEFRKNHYDVFSDVVPPLLRSNDKLLRLLVIRHADLKKRKELNLLKDFSRSADPIDDQPELLALVELGHKRLNDEIRSRPNLSGELRGKIGF